MFNKAKAWLREKVSSVKSAGQRLAVAALGVVGVLASLPAKAAEPTYTSHMGPMLSEVGVDAMKGDVILFYGGLFAIILLGAAFVFATRKTKTASH